MVMRGIGSFYCPEPRVISRGAAEGSKQGRGVMDRGLLSVSPNNCFIVPIQYIYARLFTLVEFFYEHVNRKSAPTFSRLCHGSSPIFEEFLS